jgi:hypothetical protein
MNERKHGSAAVNRSDDIVIRRARSETELTEEPGSKVNEE